MSLAVEERTSAAVRGPALAEFAARYECEDPAEAIRAAARQLLGSLSEPAPPVGLRPILRAMRADVVRRNLRSRGLLDLSDGRFVVSVHTEAQWRRERWIVAHEIGHMLILDALADRSDLVRQLDEPATLAIVERLCNAAANEILLPREDFLIHLRRFGFTPDGLQVLYERYGVGWPPIFIRMTELLGVSNVSVWQRMVRPGDRAGLRRVIGTFGDWRDGLWLPKGLSSASLSTDLVGRAYAERSASEPMLCARLTGGECWGRALATVMPSHDPARSRIPLRLRRRTGLSPWVHRGDVALLMLEPSETDAWSGLRGFGQLQLPLDTG